MNPADCGSLDDKVCCANYYWSDDENDCLPCEIGYFGDNCIHTCPPGQYGKLCGKVCNCLPGYYCDRVFGCVTKDTTIQTSTSIKLSTSVTSSERNKTTLIPVWITTVSSEEMTIKQSSVLPTMPTKKETNNNETNNNTIVLLMGAVIAFLILIIILAVIKKFCSKRSKRKYSKKENELKNIKEGNESEMYHEINMDEMMVNEIEVPDNRYNRIMDDIVRPKYLQIGSKIEKEIKQTYHEIDKENSTSTGNNGEYLEPESSGRVHAYIDVIEPLIHNSDSLNTDKDEGSSSNKSDKLEEYQDTVNFEQSDKSSSTEINDPKTHESTNNEYLDVVNVL